MGVESLFSTVISLVLLMNIKSIGCGGRFPPVILLTQRFVVVAALGVVLDDLDKFIPPVWIDAQFHIETVIDAAVVGSLLWFVGSLENINDGQLTSNEGIRLGKRLPLGVVWSFAVCLESLLPEVLFVEVEGIFFRNILPQHELQRGRFGSHRLGLVVLDGGEKLGSTFRLDGELRVERKRLGGRHF